MFIRDCRNGMGEREVGRKLLWETREKPENILEIGRADDIFYLGLEEIKENKDKTGGKYFEFLRKSLTQKNYVSEIENFNIRKWMPRERGNNKEIVKYFRHSFNYIISSKEYRKMIVNNETTEAILSREEKVKDYSQVPSLAMLKHWRTFFNKDRENFQNYLEGVKKGETKLNTGTMTPYDIIVNYSNRKINADDCDIIFNQLEKVNLGKIIAIVDNSFSMKDSNSSYLKARAIGHYVSKNSSYMNNYIITFSSFPKLLELSDTYDKDMKILNSFNDYTNTDFGKVMDVIGEVTEELPDYLLVLSDMQFDQGSTLKKDAAMKKLRLKNKDIKIIWWNFNTRLTTFPETDSYGNIFLSGYNPILLKFLEVGFDGDKFIKVLIEKYKKNVKVKLD